MPALNTLPVRILLILFFTLSFSLVRGQTFRLSGKVFEKSSLEPMQGVTVVLNKNNKAVTGTATLESGIFEINNIRPDTYELHLSFIGMKVKTMPVIISADKYTGAIFLEKDPTKLKEVTIETTQQRVEQKGDTTSINASAFKVNPDATTEDLVKKMPGITIENGTVKAQGEDVKKVLLDGKEFFGDDAQMALKNLPAEVVDKVQIFNRLSDQAQFSGFNDGNTDKTLNIVTRNGRNNGTFGKLYTGYGTKDRYQAGGNVNIFKGNRRITVLGISNNINQQNFSMQDLFGGGASAPRMFGGGGPGGGGMPRGGGGGQGSPGSDMSNFMVGQQTGISTTHSIGTNYADKWGTKTQLSGSYFFNSSNTVTEKQTTRQYQFNPAIKQVYFDSSNSKTQNYNNRFNLRLEHTFDSFNSVIFTPRISVQNTSSETYQNAQNYLGDTASNGTKTTKTTTNNGLTVNSNLLLRHKFRRQGRTLSLNLGQDYNKKTGDVLQASENRNAIPNSNLFLINSFRQKSETASDGATYSANLTYTEPLTKRSQLQFSYNPSVTYNHATKYTHFFDSTTNEYDSLNTTLSNKFDNTITTQRGNIGYSYNNDTHNFSIGVTAQELELKSLQTYPQQASFNKPFFNLLPTVQYSYKFSNAKTIRLVYRTNTNTPNISQLQNVIDNSNPLLISSGNPDLKQEYAHNLMLRYGANNPQNAHSFFVFAMANLTNDYIANGVFTSFSGDSTLQSGVVLSKGSQLSKPVNLSGNKSIRGFATYGFPVKFLKSNLNVNAGVNYTSVPGKINSNINFANTFNILGGLVLGSNISPNVDFTISHNANINKVKNTLQSTQNSDYFINTSTLKANLIRKKVVLSSDISYTNYRGLGSGYNLDFFLWNAGIAYKFLKNNAGEFKLSVFDLLNQNNSVSRSVTETYVEDVRSNVLNRYFMLTFTYTIRKFNAGQAMPGNGPQKPDGMPGR